MSTLIYLDSWLVIAAKDAGVPVQTRDRSQQTVREELRTKFSLDWLQPVHRIDQPVSGAVVLARDKETFARLHRAITRGELHRSYLAVVDTPPEPAEGELRDHLLEGDRNPAAERRGADRTSVVEEGTRGAKPARLQYRTLGSTRHHTILLVQLHTGRHHQVRAQLAHRGWHIVGDARYGARRPMRDRSIALHAWYLDLPHPEYHQRIAITADLPDTPLWRGVAQALREPLNRDDTIPPGAAP